MIRIKMIIESFNTISWINVSQMYTVGMYKNTRETTFPKLPTNIRAPPYPSQEALAIQKPAEDLALRAILL